MTRIDGEPLFGSGGDVVLLDAAPEALGWIVRTPTLEDRYTVRAQADARFKALTGRYPRLRP